MAFKFEKLRVWQLSMDYAEIINNLALHFPEIKKFNLSSQIRRAADSASLNNAEGSVGQSNPDLKDF